jgi:hypothetical protein
MNQQEREEDARRPLQNVIEQIPSHEIYASLLGIKPAVSAAAASPLLSSSAGNVIAIASDDAVVEATSAFSRAYHKALASSTTLSCLKLDQSNKGFRLLSQLGWRENEGGLGRRRQGNLEPVKTALKRNKMGLGAEPTMKARITHQESPKPPKTIQSQQKRCRKRERELEREQSLSRDKDIRFMLRTDVSEEYSELYRSLHVSSHEVASPRSLI